MSVDKFLSPLPNEIEDAEPGGVNPSASGRSAVQAWRISSSRALGWRLDADIVTNL
jgi:hypothetical protein